MAEVRRRRGSIHVSLTTEEATALVALATQVAELLGAELLGDEVLRGDASEPADPLEAMVGMPVSEVSAPDDPALQRLLPDAYAEDAAAAGEFRRLMDGDLRRLKVEALDAMRGSVVPAPEEGARLQLSDEQAETWLQAINDIRLVLGVRLDVTEDMTEMYERLPADDPRASLLAVYDWLGWLQESLVKAVAG